MSIDKVQISGFEEVIRFDKKTIVYVIEYYIRGIKFITKRSYSEFVFLNKEINKTKPVLALPELPPKTILYPK
jgi:hypothetical protein